MWSDSFRKHSGDSQGLWAGPGILRIIGNGLGSQSSWHRSRLNKWFQTRESSNQSSEEVGEHLKLWPGDEFLLKSGQSKWSPSVLMCCFSVINWGLSGLQLASSYWSTKLWVWGSYCLLLLRLSTLQTAQHVLKLPLVRCLSISHIFHSVQFNRSVASDSLWPHEV